MIFDCPEVLRRAIKIRAGELGISSSDCISRLLSEALPGELERAAHLLAAEGAATHGPPKRRPGRKPRG